MKKVKSSFKFKKELMFIILFVGGGFFISFLTNDLLTGNHYEKIKEVELTTEEQETFMANFLQHTNKDGEPSELVKDLNAHIAGLDEKNASDAVDALLYTIYQHREEMNAIVQGLQPRLETIESKGFDLNDKKSIEKVDDQVVKAFLEQVNSRYLVINKENQQYEVVADFDRVLSQYEKFMADDLKAMVEFSKEEYQVKYYDEKTQKMNLDVIANRIVLMETLEKKHPDSYYASWFNQSKFFYYQIYFGMNGNSITKKDQTLLPDMETHFKKMITNHEGTEFAKNIASFFDEYEKNNQKLNENVYVFLLDLTKKEHQQMTSPEGTSTDQAKDAIEEAIEESKDEK